MSDQDALLAAIVAHPDDDTPRLVYADWLDEHAPDAKRSPADGPSARAEYIRVQCRLAGRPFDAPDYPELLEREEDLAEWLQTHTPDEADPKLPDELEWYGTFDSGDDGDFVRGFPDECQYDEFEEEPQKNIDRMIPALERAFATTTVRTLMLEDAFGSEIAGVVGHPVAAGLRGLLLSDISENDDDNDDDESRAVRAIADSPHLSGLRRLTFGDFRVDNDGLRRLAKSRYLSPDTLSIDFASAAGLKALSQARWFRDLRELRVWIDERDAFKAIAEFPSMPNLVSLSVRGSVTPSSAAVRKFIASKSFPRLTKLEFMYTELTPELMSILARGEWPLRHLKMNHVALRRDSAAALAGAAFADGLRVLELPSCELTVSAVQALANAPTFANLRHLELNQNAVGAGGLRALARSKSLRGLRKLSLTYCNTKKAPLNASAIAEFLSSLEMSDLRHLHLDNLPVGVRGGRALGGGNFRELTRLSVSSCGLRENGARAIVESTALPNLSVLYLTNNNAGTGLSKLADPTTFPRLAAAYLANNRLPKSPLTRLRKRPGVHV